MMRGRIGAIVHDVTRGDIVVNQRFLLIVKVFQPLQDADCDSDGLLYRQPVFAAEQLGQQSALNIVGNEVGVAFIADRLDPRAPACDQRRMLQPCAGLHLEGQSALGEPRLGNAFQIEDFQEKRLLLDIGNAVGLGAASLLDKKTHDITAGEGVVIL